MVFSSITFLYYFLPIVLFIYFVVPAKGKNIVLLISSFVFYGWGEAKYLGIMVFEIAVAYIMSIYIEKYRNEQIGKSLCCISIVLTLSFLLFFKYADFIILNLNSLTSLDTGLLNIALPAGISFYTFQIISYTVDIYSGKGKRKGFLNFATYVAMFPQLIAGPIVRYNHISSELDKRTINVNQVSYGIRRFVIGLGKKVLIANQLAELSNIITGTENPSSVFSIINAIAYGLFVYYDFSGYSDMAIGIGRMLGFNFRENFNYPFISASVTEFWQRWHISLGTWFRDYVYIPLGGNKKGIKRQLFNVAIVWILTGLWHGAGWNFILWGIYFGIVVVVEKAGFLKYLHNHKWFSHVYLIIVVTVSFVIFKGENTESVINEFKCIFSIGNIPVINEETLYYAGSFAFVLIFAVIGATPLIKNTVKKIPQKIRNIIELFYIPAIMILVTAYLSDGTFNPFLYFRF